MAGKLTKLKSKTTSAKKQAPDEAAIAAEEFVDDAREALQIVQDYELTSQQDLEAATASIADIKEALAKAESTRALFVDPLIEVIERYKGYFKPAIDSLKKAEAVGKDAIARYVQHAAEQRALLLSRVDDAPSERARTAMIAKAAAHDIEPVSGLSIRETWRGEVEDASKIPRKYLIPDVRALEAATKAAKGDPKIAGWRAYVETSTAITASKVSRE